MNTFLNDIFAQIDWESALILGIKVLFTVALALLVFMLFRRSIKRLEARMVALSLEAKGNANDEDKRIRTLTRLFRQATSIGIWIVTGIILLAEFGINVGPVLAGAGIAGVAFGFGAQNLVRDLISGFFITIEDQIRIGDFAVINGTAGVVERINLRTIVLRDLADVVHVFPSGTITALGNMTKEKSAWVFDLPVAFKENTDGVTALISGVLDVMVADPVFGPLIIEKPEIFGVDSFKDSAVTIKGRIRTLPGRQWEVGREFMRRVKLTFDGNHVEIPYPHRTVYFADARSADLSRDVAAVVRKDQ